MNRINLNGWFIDENTFSRSFMRFCVNIYNYVMDNKTHYVMSITFDDNNIQRSIYLNFKTLEAALMFANNVIDKCTTFDEIMDNYELIEKNGPKTYHL